MFRNEIYQGAFFAFLLLNLLLYLFIINFDKQIPFNKENYLNNFHHFFEDPRIKGGEFNFLNSLGQSDSQWYLKIATAGYPKNPSDVYFQGYKGSWEVLIYAFFPLYPIILYLFNFLFKNIELTAFVVANLLMILNFFSLYFVISKLFKPDLAFKTIFLIFTFPFSIFFRSYFTEGLYLFLLVWFSYFLIKKKFLLSAFFLGFLNITRGNGLFLNFMLLYYIIIGIQNKYSLKKAFLAIALLVAPFFAWMYFNFLNTGNYLYFYFVQGNWFPSTNIFEPILSNIVTILSFNDLRFHLFHSSKVDVIAIIVSGALIFFSRKFLPNKLWWISFSLWILPLVFKDIMSFSRYLIIIFPLFIYLAYVLPQKAYFITVAVFLSCLFFVSIYFVNWYWIG